MATPQKMFRANARIRRKPRKISSHRHRSLWTFEGLSLREIAVQTGKNVANDDLTGRSAQLAYYFFLSLFPGLIFLSSVIGLVAGSKTHIRDHMLQSFAAFLPPTAYALVTSTFNEILKTSTARTALLGAVFALWTATSGMTAAQDTLNGVFKVKETRSLVKLYLIAIVLTVVVLILALSALIVFFYGGKLVTLISHEIGLNAGLTFIWRSIQWPIALFLLSLAFAVTYYWAPDLKDRHWKWFTPGSVLGIVGWLAVSGAFRGYLHFFNRYSLTYGSLGAVIILLLWFYLTGFMLLLGAELNGTIAQLGAKAESARKQRPQRA
jgi:membrane protein